MLVGDKRRIAFCLEGVAAAIARREPARAAQLFGAAEGLREIIGSPLPPSERADYEVGLGLARAGLDAATFAAAQAAGVAMTIEQTVALAVSP